MTDRHDQFAREIFDTHDITRRYEVTHLTGPKLYRVNSETPTSDGGFSVITHTSPGGKELSLPLDSFVNILNSLQPEESLQLDTILAVKAMTRLADFRCTVRAN